MGDVPTLRPSPTGGWLWQILPGYVDLVLVQAAKDAVCKHHARHCDFRRGKVRNWRPRHPAVPNDVPAVDGSR